MHVVENGPALREWLANAPRPFVLVPTMGAFHEGHISLMKRARELAGPLGTVIVSIFVNPIQFDRASDLDAYPRPMDSDLAACETAMVDCVFTPAAESMYFPDRSVTVSETFLARNLCGATRPGHFDGVCTVVLKLFLLTGCDTAVFGEKDFQQLAIIRRMVRDLDVPVEIISCPTFRESDGLAMSSRNTRLSAEQRADAPRIRTALSAAAALNTPKEILATARAAFDDAPLATIDYVALVDAETLQPATDLTRPTILAAAIFYGEVRLIDHEPVSMATSNSGDPAPTSEPTIVPQKPPTFRTARDEEINAATHLLGSVRNSQNASPPQYFVALESTEDAIIGAAFWQTITDEKAPLPGAEFDWTMTPVNANTPVESDFLIALVTEVQLKAPTARWLTTIKLFPSIDAPYEPLVQAGFSPHSAAANGESNGRPFYRDLPFAG